MAGRRRRAVHRWHHLLRQRQPLPPLARHLAFVCDGRQFAALCRHSLLRSIKARVGAATFLLCLKDVQRHRASLPFMAASSCDLLFGCTGSPAMKSLSHPLRSGASAALLALSISVLNSAFAVPKAGDLEVVAELPMRPGNVAPAPHNRLFAT